MALVCAVVIGAATLVILYVNRFSYVAQVKH